jgi:dipeptidyl aminopeptidase/acylaminoacyl peptidase
VAYVSPIKEGAKRPAVLWIAGGFDWSVEPSSWEPASRSNDQSARAFRDAGIVLMRPSLRGSNENPGKNECFLGEVDDVLAAADYLAKRPDVEPQRIYLGGHSTGGTMVLLVAASTARFRAAFAFGPVADPRQYGDDGCLPAQISEAEWMPRSPVTFLSSIRTRTLIIEGADGNVDVFAALRDAKGEAPITLHSVPRANHFNVLAPATEALAAQILTDNGAQPRFELDVAAVSKRVAPPEAAE